MKQLLFFGSRTLRGEKVTSIIHSAIVRYHPDVIATAINPKGVCAEVQLYARRQENGIKLVCYTLDKSRAQGKHEARSIKAISESCAVVFVWDGESKGTANEIEIAIKLDKPHEIIRIKAVYDPFAVKENHDWE